MQEHRIRLRQLGLDPSLFSTINEWPRIARFEDVFRILGPLGVGSTAKTLFVEHRASRERMVLKIYFSPLDTTFSQQQEETQSGTAATATTATESRTTTTTTTATARRSRDVSDAVEIDTLASVLRVIGNAGHPNIVGLKKWFVWTPAAPADLPDILAETGRFDVLNQYVVLALEHVQGKDFEDFISQYWSASSPMPPPPHVVRAFMRDLLSGLAFLHALGIAHRDIKSENIRVRQRARQADSLVLIDLGFACNLLFENVSDNVLSCQNRPRIGTPIFLSPEFAAASRDARPLSAIQLMASDVWAAALTVAQFVTGNNAHERAIDVRDVLSNLRSYTVPPLAIYALDTTVNSLLHRMLDADWSRRITASEALETLEKHMFEPPTPFSAAEIQNVVRTQRASIVPQPSIDSLYHVAALEQQQKQSAVKEAEERAKSKENVAESAADVVAETGEKKRKRAEE